MPTATRSTLALLISDRIGEDVYSRILRDHPGRSYRAIADDLTAESGAEVSREAVRRWHDDAQAHGMTSEADIGREANRDPAA